MSSHGLDDTSAHGILVDNSYAESVLNNSYAVPTISRSVTVAKARALAAPISLNNVPLNIDPNPEIINKKPVQPIHYKQKIGLKFLKPPTPEQPGDIVIRQERDVQIPPAPPLLVRQQPPKPLVPAPLVVREQPPPPPSPISSKLIVIPGKVVPPPPRKVIVERLPKLPQLPQDIVVERWLGYNNRTRRVIFQKAPKLVLLPAPKNTIIEWSSPDVKLHREYKFLGVERANPEQYAAAFGQSLRHASQLPQLAVSNIGAPSGQVLGVQYRPDLPTLIGDVAALRLINLESAGLADYLHNIAVDSQVNASASYAASAYGSAC